MSIPTFSNGDSMGDVRLYSLNPAITEVNRLTNEVLTLGGESDTHLGLIMDLQSESLVEKTKVSTLQTQMATAQSDIDTTEAGLVAINQEVDILTDLTVRTKVEAVWTTPIVIPTTGVNLISLLKAVTPSSGSLTAPLIDLANNKITPLNKNKTLMMKLSMTGSYGAGGASADKAVLLTLGGGVSDGVSDFKGGGLFTGNDAVITLLTMISVDKDGNATTLGVIPTIQSFVRTFTTTRVVLVIDQ